MKRVIYVVIALMLILAMTACSNVPKNNVLSPNDVSGKRIGVMQDSAAVYYTRDYGTVYTYATGDSLAEDLKNGSLDCVIADKIIAESLVSRKSGIKILDEPFVERELSFVVAKENADLTEAINGALEQLEISGVLQNIIDSYIPGSDYNYSDVRVPAEQTFKLKLVVPNDFPPYDIETPGSGVTGMDIDIAHAVCDILGAALELQPTDHENLINEVWYGYAGIALGDLAKNDADAANVDFSEPYTTSTQVIIVRKR